MKHGIHGRKEGKAYETLCIDENWILQMMKLPTNGEVTSYIYYLTTRSNMLLVYISNSPPQVGRCSQHFQLGMNNRKVHQTNENIRRNAGNTSAKSKVNNQKPIQQVETTTQGLTA
jgi:hypothetical protein